MAKRGTSDVSGLLLIAVAGFIAYEYWPQLSAWFSSAAGAPVQSTGLPATAGPLTPSLPGSAGTLVSTLAPATGPVAVAPSSAGTLVPTAPAQSGPQPIGPGSTQPLQTIPPAGTVIAWHPTPGVLPVLRGPLVSPAAGSVPVYGMPHYRSY